MNKIKSPRWNGESCEAEVGHVKCGKSPLPTWWCSEKEGVWLDCIRISYQGDIFYLHNTSEAFDKVFQYGGGPRFGHSNIPVDDPTSFARVGSKTFHIQLEESSKRRKLKEED